jgi:hypothetical protein
MIALARASSNCKGQTHPLVREDIIKDYNRKCSVEKDTGRGFKETWRRDELMGGKPPVLK